MRENMISLNLRLDAKSITEVCEKLRAIAADIEDGHTSSPDPAWCLEIPTQKVFLMFSGFDKHGEGCPCGICNNIGKSFEFSIYPFTCFCRGRDENCEHPDMRDDLPECIEKAYGCSEDVAFQNAKAICKEKRYEIVI